MLHASMADTNISLYWFAQSASQEACSQGDLLHVPRGDALKAFACRLLPINQDS